MGGPSRGLVAMLQYYSDRPRVQHRTAANWLPTDAWYHYLIDALTHNPHSHSEAAALRLVSTALLTGYFHDNKF
jgi:hypothetical protein